MADENKWLYNAFLGIMILGLVLEYQAGNISFILFLVLMFMVLSLLGLGSATKLGMTKQR